MNHLEKEIQFLGFVPPENVPSIMNAHDILLLPSINEAIGMVVPESMSCGVVPIISDTCGATTYVTHKKNGLIFKTRDINDLYATIQYALNSTKREKMAQEARKTILKKYTLQITGKNYSSFIKKLLKN